MAKKEIYLILHNLRSVYNVGSIFRTADAAGISKIFLTGYTPAPTDRFGRIRSDVAKTALGAEKNISWKKTVSINSLLEKLKKDGFLIVSVEQAKNSLDYKKVSARGGPAFGWKGGIVFIFGSETKGLPDSVLEKSDIVAEIPMKGRKESLNVSVSAGIALFRILNI